MLVTVKLPEVVVDIPDEEIKDWIKEGIKEKIINDTYKLNSKAYKIFKDSAKEAIKEFLAEDFEVVKS